MILLISLIITVFIYLLIFNFDLVMHWLVILFIKLDEIHIPYEQQISKVLLFILIFMIVYYLVYGFIVTCLMKGEN
jgi:hypothetical protein